MRDPLRQQYAYFIYLFLLQHSVRYVFRMVFAPDRRQTLQEEYLNPQNKFNSCGISLPTFPYYYR